MKSFKFSLCLFVLILITFGDRSVSNIINGKVQSTKENIKMILEKKDRNIERNEEINKSIKLNSYEYNQINTQLNINKDNSMKIQNKKNDVINKRIFFILTIIIFI